MVSCNVRMKPFDIAEMRELLRYDEMELDHMGDAHRKVALFCSMSDTDSTFDFVFALLMQQSLDSLCETALKRFSDVCPDASTSCSTSSRTSAPSRISSA